jgi:SulP family sulfate permease
LYALIITMQTQEHPAIQKSILSRVADFGEEIPGLLLRPITFISSYDRQNLRADLIAGVTIAVILLPQAVAFALIAELPPQMGLYTAIIGGVVGALWGSSNHVHTGPTNAVSLLVLSILLSAAERGSQNYLLAAGLLAVLAGGIQFLLGLARLGVLVNFVSHSVIVGFASGAGVLIAINQLKHFLGVSIESHNAAETLHALVLNLSEANIPTVLLGFASIAIILAAEKINRKLPATLITMIVASALVYLLSLEEGGVSVIGRIPSSLPPVARLPILDRELIGELMTGAVAIAAIGLVETSAIAKAIAAQTGQRLDSNQEFVGQGLANIFSGFFSGYPAAGSFSRSALTFRAGGKTAMAGLLSSVMVLIGMFTLAPLAIYLPRTALAAVLILTAYGMIDRKEISRIWRGAPGDAFIMVVTFLGTLFLHIESAVLIGIFISFAIYIIRTSTPRVRPVQPDERFKHLIPQPGKPECPQLGILDILGDLYFGAVNHVEKAVRVHREANPYQRFLLLRMSFVDQCDMSGIHTLENIVDTYRASGGDIYLFRARRRLIDFMKSTGFYDYLGADHFLDDDSAISYIFHQILDPAVCIYECEIRAFKECQILPKQTLPISIPAREAKPSQPVPKISSDDLWDLLHSTTLPFIVDVREPREYRRGHIQFAASIPLHRLFEDTLTIPRNRRVVLVCRGGRRSHRGATRLFEAGYSNISVVDGGMLAWEAAGLLEAVESLDQTVRPHEE